MRFLFFVLFNLFFLTPKAQEKNLYFPAANAEKDIAEALVKAKSQNKFVLIQAGGNWCSWCLEFARVATSNQSLDSTIKNNFVWYHLNYSTENTNEAIFQKLDFPQRFGFPTFIILDADGKRIHTQNSEYLEDGKKSYNVNKVQAFLDMWSPKALNPKMYGR